MANHYEALKKALHFDLIPQVSSLTEGRLSPPEAEDLIARLAVAIQEFPYPPLTTAFVEAVRAMPELCPSPQTVRALAPLPLKADSFVPSLESMEAMRLISNAAPENREAHHICEELLNHYDEALSGFAALGLARCGDLRTEIWLRLWSLLHLPDCFRSAVCKFFKNASPAAVGLMLHWLSGEAKESENDEWLRLPYRAADVLLEMGKEKEVVECLLPRLNAEDNEWKRLAGTILIKTSLGAEQAKKAMLPMIEDIEYGCRVAMALHEAGKADNEVIQILLSRLQSEDRDELWAITETLMLMERSEPEITEALWRMIDVPLQVENRWHRDFAVCSLIRLNQINEQLIEIIISMLPDYIPGWGYIHSNIDFLRDVPDADERIVRTLLPYLSGDYDYDMVYPSYEVARLLLGIGKAENEAIAVLMKLLDELLDDELLHDPWLPFEAAEFLVEKGKATDAVEATLRAWLNNDDNGESLAAAQLLRRMGKVDEAVFPVLLRLTESNIEASLSALPKIFLNQPVADSEILALRQSLQIAENLYNYQFEAREMLFSLLYEKLQN